MDPDRRTRIWRLVVQSTGGSPVRVNDVCTAAILSAGIDSAAVTVTLAATPRETLYASPDGLASRLEELALTVGEGPCVVALGGSPSLVADLAATECMARWPAFAPAAVGIGVRAVFALPLQIGAIRLGVLDLYRVRPGELDQAQLADVLMLADIACSILLDVSGDRVSGNHASRDHARGDHAPRDHARGDHAPRDHASRDHARGDDVCGDDGGSQDAQWPELANPQDIEVHQATGMVSVQLGVTAAIALVRLRAHAYANGRRLREVAGDVVARRMRFDPDPDGGNDQ